MKRFFIILFIFAVLLSGGFLFACSSQDECLDEQLIKDKFRASRLVFVGEVTRIDRREQLKNVEFKISKVYKGDALQTVVVNAVNTGSSSATCGFDFRLGEQYVVYAYGLKPQKGGTYFVDICGGARKFSCANYELGKLDILTRETPSL